MKPKWPSQLREYVPKLKIVYKYDILIKKLKFFFMYSSVYYPYRLNGKKSLIFAIF